MNPSKIALWIACIAAVSACESRDFGVAPDDVADTVSDVVVDAGDSATPDDAAAETTQPNRT